MICAAGAFDTANPEHNGLPGYVPYCVIFMVYSFLFNCLFSSPVNCHCYMPKPESWIFWP